MAIDQDLTGSNVSSSSVPVEIISDVVIEGTGIGRIEFQVEGKGGKWIKLADGISAFTVSTPDTSLNYRFKATGVVGTAHVYMGP